MSDTDANTNKNNSDQQQIEHEELEKMRHSFTHILAQAVLRLHPEAKLGIGPVVDSGFYYEFELTEQPNEKELKRIEKEMRKIIEQEMPIAQVIIPREEAFDMLHQQGQIYKTELLQEIPDEQFSFYKTGDEFIDLCRGPHVSHTGKLKSFKLMGVDKVHWMDDPNRPLLYKIKGLAFGTEKELEEYLKWEQEKIKKEHKVLGPQRDYFNLRNNSTGPGLQIWLNEGTKAISLISEKLKAQRHKYGFIEVSTPAIAKVNLFKETGHFEFYQDQDINPFKLHNELYMLRPMATPLHIEVFRSKRQGYNNMPVRIFELAKLYREESSQELNGLARTREFTQDIAHIFIQKEKIVEEVVLHARGQVLDGERSRTAQGKSTQKVIVISPTTFMAYLQSVLYGFKAFKIEESAKEIIKKVGDLGKHLKSFDEYHNKLGNALATAVNHYNTSGRELKKIDKDVLRVTGSSPEISLLERHQRLLLGVAGARDGCICDGKNVTLDGGPPHLCKIPPN